MSRREPAADCPAAYPLGTPGQAPQPRLFILSDIGRAARHARWKDNDQAFPH